MSGANFTPGPWRVTGPNVRADTHEGESALVAVVKDHWHNHTLRPEEKAANTRLIAAAPSLLAALERLVEAVDPAVGNNLPPGLIDAAIDALLAIAKATAKEPKA